MQKKFLLNRKALSPIFATLIILAVVTTLFIPVFIWASGITSNTQDQLAQSGEKVAERILIEEVSLAANQNGCTIYVRNIGTTSIAINNVLISASNKDFRDFEKSKTDPRYVPVNELVTVQPGTTTNVNYISQGDLIEIQIPNLGNSNIPAATGSSFHVTAGVTYTIQVFTARAVSDSYEVVAE